MADQTTTTGLVGQYRAAATAGQHSNSYKGLRIHALPGLHEFVGQLVADHFEAGATLLDMAAGSGAMCLRMRDMGFKVHATDYVPENFRLPDVPFVQADLNAEFGISPISYGALIASEIIEHLENPRHFARQCFRLLKPGGRMILTTPNVESPASKASFIRSGRALWFSDEDYKVQGHINPLPQWVLCKCFEEAGFKFRFQGSFGAASKLGGSPRLAILTKLIAMLSTCPPELSGEIYVVVLERPATNSTTGDLDQ